MSDLDSIPAIIDQLCEMFDESVAGAAQRAGPLSAARRAARSGGAGARPVRLSRAQDRLQLRPAAQIPAARLRPAEPARPLRDQHRPARATSANISPSSSNIWSATIRSRSRSALRRAKSPIPTSSTAPTISRLDDAHAADLSRWFPATELSHIGDEVADGTWDYSRHPDRPLALFDGPRVDFSLARLRHYTGTPVEHTQRYLLFTNYVRYVDEFVRWAAEELRREDSPYEALSAPGGVLVTRDTPDPVARGGGGQLAQGARCRPTI